jgi:hypothetical protein
MTWVVCIFGMSFYAYPEASLLLDSWVTSGILRYPDNCSRASYRLLSRFEYAPDSVGYTVPFQQAGSLLRQNSIVAPLKYMTRTAVIATIDLGVHTIQLLHARA